MAVAPPRSRRSAGPNELGFVGIVGLLALIASGPGGIVAGFVVLSLSRKNGTSTFRVMCRLIGWFFVLLVGMLAILGLLVGIDALISQ